MPRKGSRKVDKFREVKDLADLAPPDRPVLDDPTAKDPWDQHLTERLMQDLYTEEDKRNEFQPLSNFERKLRNIVRDIFTRWLSHPELTEQQMRDVAHREFGLKIGWAQKAVRMAQFVCGNVPSANQAWMRYMVTHMLRTAYQRAEAKEDVRSMISAANALGHFAMLDKTEAEKPDWSKIAPPTFEPTMDATSMGFGNRSEVEVVRQRLARKFEDKHQGNRWGQDIARVMDPDAVTDAVLEEDDDSNEPTQSNEVDYGADI